MSRYASSKLKPKSKKKDLIVFTDGSCSGNGKAISHGGIGIHFPNNELPDLSKIFRAGGCTNQRTELYAILTAVRYIKKNLGLSGYRVKIKTDSGYSIDCITKWVNGWKENGWRKKDGSSVANKEYIELIDKYYQRYDITMQFVAAHTTKTDPDSVGNARADKLATDATKRAKIESGNSRSPKYQGQSKKYSGSKTNKTSKNNKYNRNNQSFSKLWKTAKKDHPIIVELVKSK